MKAAKYRGFLWFENPTSMSSLLKVILLVSCRKVLLALVSADKYSTLAPEAMLTRASVEILCSLAMNAN